MTRTGVLWKGGALAVLGLVGVAAFVAVPGLLSPGGSAPHFVEQASAAGVTHAYTGDFDFYVGGGVAVFDCDGDGRPDIYLAGGSSPAALFHNDSAPGGALRFTQVPDATTDLSDVVGAYPLDIDSDGLADLVVLRRGENVLLRGLGGCRFERANETWSFDGGAAWTTAFSARWDAGASLPTMAFGSYLDPATENTTYQCEGDALVRPNAAGDGFAPAQPLSPSWCSLSMLFSDWNRSGQRDLRVSNDRQYYNPYSGGQDQLWRVPAAGSPSLYTAADGWQKVQVWGMGIASYDVTGDGYPDYFLTSQGDNKLQTLANGPAQPNFTDIALARDATLTRPYEGDTTLPSTAWHDEFADVNNDGLIDLFVSKGNVEAEGGFAQRDPSSLLLGQADGTFREAAPDAGLVDFARARGAALVDLNADGLLDLIVVVRQENVRLWRNVGSGSADTPGAMGNWLAVTVHQPGANPDARGGWLEVEANGATQQRELTVGGGHASGELVPIHFGLGSATGARVRMTWPDGEVGPWLEVQANTRVVIERGAPAPTVL